MVTTETSTQFLGILSVLLFMSYFNPTTAEETLITGRLVAEHKAPGTADCKNGFTPVCEGCTDLAICVGGSKPILTQPCSELSPNAPYCFNGGCVPKPPPGLKGCVRTLRCSGAGYFPHPDNCQKYFICTAENGNAFEYSCGPGYYFNSKVKFCQREANHATDCHAVNCTGINNAFTVFKPNPTFYAFCLNNKGKDDVIIYKCPNEKFMEFNLLTLKCEFKCPAEGRFENPDDCNSFYECYRSTKGLEGTKWPCPGGNAYHYDSKIGACVPGSCKK